MQYSEYLLISILTIGVTVAPASCNEIGTAALESSGSHDESTTVAARSTEYTGHGDPTDQEQYLLELVNRARMDPAGESQKYGSPNDKAAVAPLAMNGILLGAARAHSKDMNDRNFFDHTNPDNKSPFDRMTAGGYSWSSAGENIAKGQSNVEAAHSAWLNSSGHRANIYGSSFTEIGPGVYFGQSRYYTQKFGKQSAEPTKFVLGVVFDDKNGNNFYDPGEGLGGVRVEFTVGGNTCFTATGSVGGYAIPYTANATFDVSASGGALRSTLTKSTSTTGANVKVDFISSGSSSGGTAPSITSQLSASGTKGETFSYTITASGDAPITFSTSSLPSGLSLSGATISGSPTVSGNFAVTLTASNNSGSDSKDLTIAIAASGSGGGGDGGSTETFTSNTDTDTDGDKFPNEIEEMMGTSALSASSTPFDDKPAGTVETLDVLKAIIKLNFGVDNRDAVTIAGTLPVPEGFVAEGAEVTVDCGGVIKTFTLDSKGRSPNDSDSFRIRIQSKNGVVAAQNAKYVIKFKLGFFRDSFSDEGLKGENKIKDASRDVPIIVLFDETIFRVTRGMLYSANALRSGVAK